MIIANNILLVIMNKILSPGWKNSLIKKAFKAVMRKILVQMIILAMHTFTGVF